MGSKHYKMIRAEWQKLGVELRRAELRQMHHDRERNLEGRALNIKESIKKELGVSEKFEIAYAGGCSHEKQTSGSVPLAISQDLELS